MKEITLKYITKQLDAIRKDIKKISVVAPCGDMFYNCAWGHDTCFDSEMLKECKKEFGCLKK
jgi:hypothetical protein